MSGISSITGTYRIGQSDPDGYLADDELRQGRGRICVGGVHLRDVEMGWLMLHALDQRSSSWCTCICYEGLCMAHTETPIWIFDGHLPVTC